MGKLTYSDGISILQLIVFPVLLASSIYIWKRTGWRSGRHTWRLAVILSAIRHFFGKLIGRHTLKVRAYLTSSLLNRLRGFHQGSNHATVIACYGVFRKTFRKMCRKIITIQYQNDGVPRIVASNRFGPAQVFMGVLRYSSFIDLDPPLYEIMDYGW
jgi:hypothetical protein